MNGWVGDNAFVAAALTFARDPGFDGMALPKGHQNSTINCPFASALGGVVHEREWWPSPACEEPDAAVVFVEDFDAGMDPELPRPTRIHERAGGRAGRFRVRSARRPSLAGPARRPLTTSPFAGLEEPCCLRAAGPSPPAAAREINGQATKEE